METKDIIRTGRERLGMNHQQFATAVGVSRGAVQQWEKGDTAPKRSHQKRVADLLGVSVAELMGQSQPDQQTIRDTVNLSSGISEIPLLDRKTAGMYKDYLDSGKVPPAVLEHPGEGKNLFAYLVDDDLMEPMVPFNARAVISTKIKPKHGSIVLIEQDGVCVLRKLVIDGQTQLVETVKYQTAKPLTGTIIGVVHMVSFLIADLERDEE